jgi:hypothetical protein
MRLLQRTNDLRGNENILATHSTALRMAYARVDGGGELRGVSHMPIYYSRDSTTTRIPLPLQLRCPRNQLHILHSSLRVRLCRVFVAKRGILFSLRARFLVLRRVTGARASQGKRRAPWGMPGRPEVPLPCPPPRRQLRRRQRLEVPREQPLRRRRCQCQCRCRPEAPQRRSRRPT